MFCVIAREYVLVMLNSWTRSAHEGFVECTCFQIAAICLSKGKLEEKYRGELVQKHGIWACNHAHWPLNYCWVAEYVCRFLPPGLFQVISGNQESIDLDQLTEFLEKVVQVRMTSCGGCYYTGIGKQLPGSRLIYNYSSIELINGNMHTRYQRANTLQFSW